MTEVTIVSCVSDDELHRQYHGQHYPQPCFIALDLRTGRLWADYDPNIGGGTDMDVFHGFERHWGIPCLTATAANTTLEQIAPVAQRMLDDWNKHWNGNNTVAVLGEDAVAAEEHIADMLGGNLDDHDPRYPFTDSDQVTVWSVDGAVNGQEAEEYEITADTTDERLDAIATDITDAMRDCGNNPNAVVIIEGLDAYLRGLRDDARAERASN